jgi:D-glycero-D-manno-heptose 1,7-bisphosphate phosphatase
LPGVASAIGELNAASIRTVLVTNQRWLSPPRADTMTYAAIQARLERLLGAEGAWLDAAYHCPHAIGTCGCRKPAAGMLLRVAAEHGFDLGSSIIVGDGDSDVLTGQSAGIRTIRLGMPHDKGIGVSADALVSDFPTAVRLILEL